MDTLLKGMPHFLAQGIVYPVSTALFLAGLITAAITRNERYHQFYAIFFFVQTICASIAIFHTLI